MNDWTIMLRDAILENSGLRENLTDEEAQPLIDWGMKMADLVGVQMAQLPADATESAFEEKKSALLKLLTRVTWTAVYRGEKGAGWTLQTLEQLNTFNRAVRGAEAPQLSATAMQQLADGQDGLAKGALVQHLLNTFDGQSAAEPATGESAAAAQPPAASPVPEAPPGIPNPFHQAVAVLKGIIQPQAETPTQDAPPAIDPSTLQSVYQPGASSASALNDTSQTTHIEDSDNGETTTTCG